MNSTASAAIRSYSAFDALAVELAATTDPAVVADMLRALVAAAQADVADDIENDLRDMGAGDAADHVADTYGSHSC